MRILLALATKDLRLLARNRGALFFTLAWPILTAVFFGVIFSGVGGGRIAIALVDEDGSDGSRAFAAVLAAQDGLEAQPADRPQAESLVRQGRRAGYVALLPGFGAAEARPLLGAPPRIELGIDPSRKAEAAILQGLLMRVAVSRLQQTPGGWQPLRVEARDVTQERRRPRNAFQVTFPQGILWGILGCAASFGIGLVSERTQGTLARLLMAPLSRAQVLAGRALASFLGMLGVEVLLFLLGRVFFDVRPGSYPLLVLAGLATAVAFVGITLLLATLGSNEQTVSGATWAAVLVMSMLGGGMVPLSVMPPWLASLSHLSPVKWGILALEGALWRGFGLAEMALPCGILLGIGIASFALGARAFRRW